MRKQITFKQISGILHEYPGIVYYWWSRYSGRAIHNDCMECWMWIDGVLLDGGISKEMEYKHGYMKLSPFYMFRFYGIFVPLISGFPESIIG